MFWTLLFASLALGQELRTASRTLTVRQSPSAAAAVRGTIPGGASFRVLAQQAPGGGCKAAWGELEGKGFVCLADTEPGGEEPVVLPVLLPFDPPTPDEYAAYRESNTWPRDPPETAERLLPLIYGKRWRRWQAPVWASPEAYERGLAPTGNLDSSRKHAFVREVQTRRGTVLVKPDGKTVPIEQVYVYPTSRFQGRDMVENPLPADILPAWVFRYEGARVRPAPNPQAEPGRILPHHEHLVVDAQPASPDGRWWRIPNGLGPGMDGYVDSEHDIRRWYPAPPPPEVRPDQVWIDIERSQQVLAVRRGDALLYVTMISSGTAGRWESPRGLYEVYDQLIWGDMASREGADETYYVESVPWIAHFYPRLALHGAYWHWGFGHKVSHGCINLAPRDAARVMSMLEPRLPPGWSSVYLGPGERGTLLRIREGAAEPPDKRKRGAG